MSKAGIRIKHPLALLPALALAASLLLAQAAGAQEDAGISTTQASGPDPATAGQPVAFTITATNNSAPQSVGLKDFLPAEMSLVSASPSQGTCGMDHHENTIACELGPVPSGGSVTVEIVATPTAPGTMTNTATGQGEVSPATAANSSEATITVNPEP